MEADRLETPDIPDWEQRRLTTFWIKTEEFRRIPYFFD